MWSRDKELSREITLKGLNATLEIGRVSKNQVSCKAAKDNCWIDSPIVSRHHAELRVGDTSDKVSFHTSCIEQGGLIESLAITLDRLEVDSWNVRERQQA